MHGLKIILLLSLAYALGEGARPEPADAALGLNREVGAFSAFAVDLDGDGTLEMGSVSHRAPSMLARQPRPGAHAEALDFPWAEIPGDRHAIIPCDLDRDGDFELLITRGGARGAGTEPMELWERQGEVWVDRAAELLPDMPPKFRARGLSCVNLDQDDHPELVIASAGQLAQDLVLDRRPDGRYVDVAEALGLQTAASTVSYTWGDVDGDGDLDGVRAAPWRAELLIQGPDGRFTASLVRQGLEAADVELIDVDGDGDLDLYASAGQAMHDAAGDGLFQLVQGEKDEDGVVWSVPLGCERLGFQVRGNGQLGPSAVRTATRSARSVELTMAPRFAEPLGGQGVSAWVNVKARQLHLRAVDLGGHITGAVTCKDDPKLSPVLVATQGLEQDASSAADMILLNDGHGVFEPSKKALPAEVDGAPLSSVDVAVLDVDLDGDLDLFLTRAFTAGRLANAPDLLLENDGRGRFTPSPRFRPAAVPPGVAGQLSVVTELHGDRYPDLLTFNGDQFGPLAGELMVWENPGGDARWLEVVVLDANGLARSLSAEVEVQAGGRAQRRLSNPAPDSRANGLSPTVFGLGEAERAERVTVRWPDGTTLELRQVPAGAVLQVVKPAALAAR